MRVLGLALAVALAFPAVASADATVQATDGVLTDGSDNRWTPNVVDVKVGETVTWRFAGTTLTHNVRNATTGTPWTIRSALVTAGPDAAYTFTAVGNYDFYCELHATPMRGTVRVSDETGTPPPPPPPPPLSEQPFPNDQSAAPVLELRDTVKPTLSRVKVSRVSGGARVRFRVSEDARVTVRIKRGSRTVKTRTVTARGNASALIRGLSAGSYRVELSARDLAGNAARAQRARVTILS